VGRSGRLGWQHRETLVILAATLGDIPYWAGSRITQEVVLDPYTYNTTHF
jgi:hypothetical protein